jgi:hypothetical protein
MKNKLNFELVAFSQMLCQNAISDISRIAVLCTCPGRRNTKSIATVGIWQCAVICLNCGPLCAALSLPIFPYTLDQES